MNRNESFTLEKRHWTDADFEVMGWHDSTVWSIAFLTEAYELVLDIDYILKWERNELDGYFAFWVAPATIVFRNVYDLKFDVAFYDDTQIQDLKRGDPGKPRNAEYIGTDREWRWVLTFSGGRISFRSSGFDQFFRRDPVLSDQQSLSLETRGGMSFDRLGS
jgi:hypothetical protein